jgi:very-short-patch-repair endonuclease
MQNVYPNRHCCNCIASIPESVILYSIDRWNYALCIPCQQQLQLKLTQSTSETIALYFSLRQKLVPAELEKFDGYKRIDIAIVPARVNIEVDGFHHHRSTQQALADLKRTYYSFTKGYLTLRIPNTLVQYKLEETVTFIEALVTQSFGRIRNK